MLLLIQARQRLLLLLLGVHIFQYSPGLYLIRYRLKIRNTLSQMCHPVGTADCFSTASSQSPQYNVPVLPGFLAVGSLRGTPSGSVLLVAPFCANQLRPQPSIIPAGSQVRFRLPVLPAIPHRPYVFSTHNNVDNIALCGRPAHFLNFRILLSTWLPPTSALS